MTDCSAGSRPSGSEKGCSGCEKEYWVQWRRPRAGRLGLTQGFGHYHRVGIVARCVRNFWELRSKSAMSSAAGLDPLDEVQESKMRHECVIIADSPGALVTLCGVSILERLYAHCSAAELSAQLFSPILRN